MAQVPYAEVDWERKWRDAEFNNISTYKRDPRRNATTTMHLAHLGPTGGQQSFYMGPAQRIQGGELRWIHPDQQKRTKMGKTAGSAEILQGAMAELDSAFTTAAGLTSGQDQQGGLAGGEASSQASTWQAGGRAAPDPFAAAAAWSTARRAQTAPTGSTRRDYRQAPSETRPLVYWDGKTQHVIEPAPGHEGPVGLQEEPLGWSLKESQQQQRLRTTANAGGLMASGTNRAGITGQGLTARNPSGTTSRQLYALSPQALAQQSLADSIRTYGMVFKPLGHKQYEETSRGMEGLNCWENTQSHLSTSTAVGRPSRQMGPWEHTTTKLSLRRPTTGSYLSQRQV